MKLWRIRGILPVDRSLVLPRMALLFRQERSSFESPGVCFPGVSLEGLCALGWSSEVHYSSQESFWPFCRRVKYEC